MKIKIRAVPNAKRAECVGMLGDAVKIKVCAPPLDGKANAELTAFISKKLGLQKKAVRVVSGETSRDKVIEIDFVENLTQIDFCSKLSE